MIGINHDRNNDVNDNDADNKAVATSDCAVIHHRNPTARIVTERKHMSIDRSRLILFVL